MQRKVLLIGDVMLDINTHGTCSRISPEAPVQVVRKTHEVVELGGAGNNLVNLEHLGVATDFISVIGFDQNSKTIEKKFSEIKNCTPFLIKEQNRKATVKNRILVNRHQVLRIDTEDSHNIETLTHNKIIEIIKKNISKYCVILISDYNKGVCTPELIREIISIANKNNIKVICDPKKTDISIFKGCYCITPNKLELESLLQMKITSPQEIEQAFLLMQNFIEIPLVTLSEKGIAYLQNGKVNISHAIAKDVIDVTGAGDTVISTIAYCLQNEIEFSKAVELANKAASIVVSKLGTSFVTRQDLHQEKTKIVQNFDVIKNEIAGKKVVFTNGCFDILHKGHVKYLAKARELGDVLIVGVNSDASVRILKGNSRPVNDLDSRMEILAGLESVSFVIPFQEETPYELIKQIQPAVLVKGGDYEAEKIVGFDIAKQTVVIDFVNGFSTTKIIEKLKK
jgi:D-beta-D-heptose 7-phosphate kinase/D-beta-D-heptose 1-phosphate adenosyltransferase